MPTQIHRCIPRYKYFEQINLKSEIGLKMYLIMLITNSFSNRHFTSSENRSKRTLNLFQIEIIKFRVFVQVQFFKCSNPKIVLATIFV